VQKHESNSIESACILLTCEHATRHVPAAYRHLFREAGAVLDSHRGWDPGALEMAEALSRASGARLEIGRATRLLVELNRSPDHPQLWSEFTRGLTDAEKEAILTEWYQPYRSRVRQCIGRHVAEGESVRHFSIHSFTPVLDGQIRDCDVGLLFDPDRSAEVRTARELRAWLREVVPGLRVRMNQPYRGVDDGFTTWLRRHFGDAVYAGIEIEFNQALLLDPTGAWSELQDCIGQYLASYEDFGHGLNADGRSVE
jgi:predicted N-formylglutamate amidohydrolase